MTVPTLILKRTPDATAPGGRRLRPADDPRLETGLIRRDRALPTASAPEATNEAISDFLARREQGKGSTAAFAALLEDRVEELYESAACGYLSTLMDGTIAKISTTVADWLGLARERRWWAG